MKKNVLIIITFLLCMTVLVACGKHENANENNHGATASQPKDTVETIDNVDNVDNVENGEKENMGGYVPCQIHHSEYHSIPFSLIDHIGREKFFEWTELDEKKPLIEGCRDNKTIYDCIHYFNVPREVLEEIYADSGWDSSYWNLDALYDEDKSVSEQFYRNIELIDSVCEKRIAFSNVKLKIVKDNFDEWVSLHGDFAPGPKHSMAYLVELFDVSREELEKYIAAVGGENTYKYDLDVLYGGTQSEGEVNINSASGTDYSDLNEIQKDAMFCGIEDWYIE